MLNSKNLVRVFLLASLLAAFSAASAGRAYGQSFTLTATSQLNPVNPGGSSTANMELLGSGGFNSAVSFTTTPCTVTPVQTVGTPVCSVTPASANPGTGGAQVSAIVTTSSSTPAGSYQVTVTGVSGALTPQTVLLTLGVSTLTEDYTLSVSPTTATPSPVTAGNTATTTVTISPNPSYSGHMVTLACSSVTPVAEPVPICSFNPEQVSITSGVPPTSVLSIVTIGPTPVARTWNRRIFYALWLLAPGLGLLGLVSTGTRRKQALGLLLLVGLSGGLLLVPACNSSTTVGNTTPKNSYTFTLSAVDESGSAPSNTTTNAATVTVSVN